MSLMLRAFGHPDVSAAPLAAGAGPGAVVLSPRVLLAPAAAVADEAGRRAVAAHALAHLCHSPRAQPVAGAKPLALAVMALLEDARAERLLAAEYPGLEWCFVQALREGDPAPGLDFSSLALRLARALGDPDYRDGNYWVGKGRAGFEELWARSAGSGAFRELGAMLANDLGQMRVRYDPDQYHRPRYRDDDSFLWDHAGAAREDQSLAVHADVSGTARPSAGQACADDESAAGDPPLPDPMDKEQAFHYPEWHHKLERLRADWCVLTERRHAGMPGVSGGPRASIPAGAIRLAPAHRLDRAQRRRRLREGEEIDLDAAIEATVEQRLGLALEPRVFMRPGRRPRRASILVLLDLSESSNDPAGAGPQTLLDIEKRAALLLAGSAGASGHRVAVHGFSSNTRHDVRYVRLLDFGQTLDAAAAARVLKVRAAFSTRMGAALRHAAHCLRGEPGEQRSVLLVTDGAPADIDVHDVRHLVEDARNAVGQARRAGVHCFCLAVDDQADAYVRRIFGARGYDVLHDAESLPARLARAFARATA